MRGPLHKLSLPNDLSKAILAVYNTVILIAALDGVNRTPPSICARTMAMALALRRRCHHRVCRVLRGENQYQRRLHADAVLLVRFAGDIYLLRVSGRARASLAAI
jgi:hypothetical protein